jgi:predicted transcriptional regulator
MPSLTVKLPATLDKKLRAVARKRGEKISTLARRAIEKEISGGAPDFAQLAANYKGMFKGPRDLSEHEGYGR